MNKLNDLTKQIKIVNDQSDITKCKDAVVSMFKDSKLGVNRKKGKEYSPLDQAIATALTQTNINKLKSFAFITMLRGEGLGV